jgi:hypothetical protein
VIAVVQCHAVIVFGALDFEARVTVAATLVAHGDLIGVASGAIGTAKSADVRVLFCATRCPPLVPDQSIVC